MLGLAFEGCAGRAAFHAGVVDRLSAAGLHPGCVAGASSGSIVAALVAGGLTERLPEVWLSAAKQPVFQPRRLFRGRWPFVMSSIVGDAVEEQFGSMRLKDLILPIAIPVTLLTLRGRRRRVLTRADDVTVVEAVLASCFIPGPYSRLVLVDGCPAVDGAWEIRTPVEALRGLGANRVLAVVANPAGELQLGFPTRECQPPPVGCVVVSPEQTLSVGAWDMDRRRIEEAIQSGRVAAEQVLVAELFRAPGELCAEARPADRAFSENESD